METDKRAEDLLVKPDALTLFLSGILEKAGVRRDVAGYVTEGLVQTSVRGVDSHGIRLFPHYLRAVKGGRINPQPNYKFKKTSLSTGFLDADHTFGHASGMEAVKHAIKMARDAGTGHIAVCNSTHFGAAAYYAIEIAKNDMIGMSFTNTDALVKTYAGKREFLGNNPICFAAPCAGEEPFCLDMATSVVTFNKIRQFREKGLNAPPGVGADADGLETTDPNRVTMLLPIGGYKGYGLSMMAEILCGLLAGMPYGPHIPKMFEAPLNQKRFLGHFIMAMRIDCFQDAGHFKSRMTEMMNELRNEPALDKDTPVQVAGDPEKRRALYRQRDGIPVPRDLMTALIDIGREYGIDMPDRKV